MGQFTTKDLIRIITALAERDQGTYVSWRAVSKIALWEMAERVPNLKEEPTPARKNFREFLEKFDELLEYAQFLTNVPGAGWVLELMLILYASARKNFPI